MNDKFTGPVIIQDCPVDHPIWKEEIFGPILAVRKAKGLAEFLALANDTEYGLGTSIYSQNMNTILAVSKQLKAGTIYINGHGFLDPAYPFGGLDMSGYGKDLDAEQFESYLEIKSLLFSGGEF